MFAFVEWRSPAGSVHLGTIADDRIMICGLSTWRVGCWVEGPEMPWIKNPRRCRNCERVLRAALRPLGIAG